jgi:hypothetical protein
VAAVLSAVSASHFLVLASPFQMLGYADVPAGMLCFVGFYTGLQSITRSGRDADRLVVLGSAVIAGGALTKQSGILFAIGFLMALKILSPSTAPVNARVTKALIVLATLILPWYIYRAIQEVFYDAGSAILFTAVKIHGTKTIWERVSTSASYLQPYFTTWGAFYFIVPGLLLACLSALGRALLLLCVIPYFVVFAIFFGYDVHNALPIIPFLAWTIGVGFGNASALCQRFISKRIQFDVWTIASGGRAAILLSRVPGVVVLASAAIFALILGFAVRHWTGAGWPNREAMYNGRLQAAMEHGNPEINRAVIALFNAPEARGPIMTSYAILLSFDQVRPFVVVDSLETFNVFTRVTTQGSRYVLDDMTGDPQVSAELEQRRRAGEFRQISSGRNWQLLAVVR